jgi:hypothetical protein
MSARTYHSRRIGKTKYTVHFQVNPQNTNHPYRAVVSPSEGLEAIKFKKRPDNDKENAAIGKFAKLLNDALTARADALEQRTT